MKSLPVKGDYYLCASCDRCSDSDEWSFESYYVHDENDRAYVSHNNDSYYFTDSCVEVEVAVCPNCDDTFEDDHPSSRSEVWRCSNCEELRELKSEGDGCCT